MDWKDTKDRPIPVTPWSLVHFGVGYCFASLTHQFGLQRSFVTFLVLHTLYEIKDTLYSTSSFVNSVFDELIGITGFLAFYKIQTHVPVWLVTTLVIAYLISPLSSKDGSWTLDIWNSRG